LKNPQLKNRLLKNPSHICYPLGHPRRIQHQCGKGQQRALRGNSRSDGQPTQTSPWTWTKRKTDGNLPATRGRRALPATTHPLYLEETASRSQ
jgi:hypothetical protein